jgi:hypothetical protein
VPGGRTGSPESGRRVSHDCTFVLQMIIRMVQRDLVLAFMILEFCYR